MRGFTLRVLTLVMLALGCSGGDPERDSSPIRAFAARFPGAPTENLRASAAPSAMATPAGSSVLTQQSPAQSPTTQPRTPAVKRKAWLVLRKRANLAAQRGVTGWRARGEAVYQALSSNAASSQAPLHAFLASRKLEHKQFWIVNAVQVVADDASLKELAARPEVEKIIEDGTFEIPPPLPGAAAGTQAEEWGLESIRAPAVWSEFGAKGDGIVVASIDTGVEYQHPALIGQYRGNLGDGNFEHDYNWFDPTGLCGGSESPPCDTNRHGTHTMGTMVGDDLGENQIGVAPRARWIAAKGCEFSTCSFEALLAAGQWILAPTDRSGATPRPDLRPHVVNNSWGGLGGDPFYREVTQAWVEAGIFPAFAAGNDDVACASISSPADYPESFAVGAYDSAGTIAYFSRLGPSTFDGSIKPNLAAPGVGVKSSVPPSGYDFLSGTSMAAPHLSGTIALLWSAAPTLARDIELTRELLAQGAADVADPRCGGTPENNNVWGEGRLDAYATVSLAPRGPAGTLSGSVFAESGEPIAGALVVAENAEITRSALSDASGAYTLRVPVGTYSVRASAFGYESATESDITLTEAGTTDLDFALGTVPSHAVAGVVRDEAGSPLAGVSVSLAGTPLEPVRTAPGGYYAFPSVPEGNYELSADLRPCFDLGTRALVVSADTTLDVSLAQHADAFGYRCRPVDFDYVTATDPVPLCSDTASFELPFAFPLYGRYHEQLSIAATGFLSLEPAVVTVENLPLPSPLHPNSAIYPFWDELFVCGYYGYGGGSVYTSVLGSAPDRRVVIEWRDAVLPASGELANFEVLLFEDGRLRMQYATTSTDPSALGGSATSGIENELGTVGFGYSYNQPVLSEGLAIEYSFPPSGGVRGTLTNQNDGLPIAGARVRALKDGAEVRAASSDAHGLYSLQLPVGSYLLEVVADNYAAQSAPVDVALGTIIERNFALSTGRAVLAPHTLSLTLLPGEQRTRTFTLSNTGTAGFDFAVEEFGGQRATLTATRLLPRSGTAEPRAFDTRGLFAQGVQPAGMGPSAAGDVLRSFLIWGLELPWGVGYTGDLWFSDFFARRDHEFDPFGAPSGRTILAAWAEGYASDMAFDSGRGLLCQIGGSSEARKNGIYCMEPSTGTVVYSINGLFDWTLARQYALAYREDDDTFYVGGWLSNTIFHVRGLSHTVPGEIIDRCTPPDSLISGLAWNPGMQVLWEATNSITDTIYELDPRDCTVLSSLAHPTPGFAGGGLDLDEDGNLWMVSQLSHQAYLMETDVPATGDVPWLSVEPATGSVSVGGARALTVRIDSSGLSTGQYLGSLFVKTSAARETTLRVPVSLIVTDYAQGVNVGAAAYTNPNGDSWAADRKHANGSWGYVQKGSTSSTNKTIEGTSDQALFRTQRVDPYAYRFDNVPNGVYEIELGFAEFENLRRKRRLADVIIEDQLLLPAHDTDFEVGRLVADSHTFFVAVADRRLDIRLVPRQGSEKPVLNALRVVHRIDR